MVTILPGIRHQTSIPNTASHPIETQHKPPQTASPLAKFLPALKVPTPAWHPLSTVSTPLVES